MSESENIEIRGLSKQHVDAVVPMRKATFQAHYKLHPDAFLEDFDEALNQAYVRNFLPRLFRFTVRRQCAIGAFFGDVLLGYTLYFIYPNPEASLSAVKRGCIIVDIAVDPAERHKAVAQKMLAHLRDVCSADNVDAINAVVWCGNEASEKLFAGAGYVAQSQSFSLALKP